MNSPSPGWIGQRQKDILELIGTYCEVFVILLGMLGSDQYSGECSHLIGKNEDWDLNRGPFVLWMFL